MKLYIFTATQGDGCVGTIANNDKRAWDWVPVGDKPHLNPRPDVVIRVDEAVYRVPGLKFRYMPVR